MKRSRPIRVDDAVAAWIKAEQKRTGKTPSQIIKALLAKTKPKRKAHD